ncbi:hypothetical protein IQ06DRAFT_296496 [Phaeosphaeriaceae sp. SRC1lsM3a]|nr:hypothetical protein IQ06DRAFT_296496 [Stagonospora sp. SRC1lsM3a]
MHLPTHRPKHSSGALSPVVEHTQDEANSPMPDNKRKDSATMKNSLDRPEPARTPSTRIQEPQQTPSHTKPKAKPQPQRGASSTSEKPKRPELQRRRTTARTRYIDMLLNLDDVSPLHNILASASVWILLAGYIVFPATFNKLQKEEMDAKADSSLKQHALDTVRNVPLLYVAAFACGIGVLGCLWLWWEHRKNYVWVINRIFLPALLNSIAGLVSTLVNVYSAQDGQYSVTAKVTVVVTAACSTVAAALFLLYNMVMLKLVKRKHAREMRNVEEMNDSEEAYVAASGADATRKKATREV